MSDSSIIGLWKLVKFQVSWGQDSQVLLPYGENPVGYLLYTEDGYMSVHFMQKDRPHCHSNSYTETTVDEKCEIADCYGGYIGRYEITPDAVIHYPEVCSFPNYVGVKQVRHFHLENNVLTLECPYRDKEHAETGKSQIIWKRV